MTPKYEFQAATPSEATFFDCVKGMALIGWDPYLLTGNLEQGIGIIFRRLASEDKQEGGASTLFLVERMQKALRDITSILGPNPTGSCKKNACEGCQHEIDEALAAAKWGLGLGVE